MGYYKKEFGIKKRRILSAINSSLKTPWGKKNIYPIVKNKRLINFSFQKFLKIPQINSSEFKENWKRFFLESDYPVFVGESGGTSGLRKQSIVPEINFQEEFTPHHSLIQNIKTAKEPLFMTRLFVTPCSFYVIQEGLKQIRGTKIKTVFYKTPESALRKIEKCNSDFIYISVSSTLFRLLIIRWKELYKKKQINLNCLKEKRIQFEIYGEQNYLAEIKEFDSFIKKIFPDSDSERVILLYGLSEFLLVGKCFFRSSMKKLLYEITSSKFCMVMDKNSKPVFNKLGKIEVTSLNRGFAKAPYGIILPRYITGDLGIMHHKGKKLFLEVVGRDPERIQFSFQGTKLAPESFARYLDLLGFPDVQIAYKLSLCEQKKVLSVYLTMKKYSKPYLNKAKIAFLKNFQRNYPDIYGVLKGGLLKLIIESKNIRFEKRWSVRKPESISETKFKVIKSDIS